MLIQVQGPRAKAVLRHERPQLNASTGLWELVLLHEQEAWNIVTNAGRQQLHRYLYGAGVQRASLSGGFNYIGLSSDATTPAASDTTLTGELVADGLNRQLATVTLPTGSNNQTFLGKVFTYTGVSPFVVQKLAVFDQASGGVMTHEIKFGQRNLFQNDTFTVTIAITLA